MLKFYFKYFSDKCTQRDIKVLKFNFQAVIKKCFNEGNKFTFSELHFLTLWL